MTRSVTGWAPTQSVGMIGKGIQNFQTTPNAPFRRPNGIIAQGVERHGCRERRDGPGMALRRWAAPGRTPGAMMERGNHAAGGAVCRGQALLVPFGGAGHPGDCQKEPAQQGGTEASNSTINSHCTKKASASCQPQPRSTEAGAISNGLALRRWLRSSRGVAPKKLR